MWCHSQEQWKHNRGNLSNLISIIVGPMCSTVDYQLLSLLYTVCGCSINLSNFSAAGYVYVCERWSQWFWHQHVTLVGHISDVITRLYHMLFIFHTISHFQFQCLSNIHYSTGTFRSMPQAIFYGQNIMSYFYSVIGWHPYFRMKYTYLNCAVQRQSVMKWHTGIGYSHNSLHQTQMYRGRTDEYMYREEKNHGNLL